jgi:formylglycine-generating enzyme required for sulfatase activity
MASLFVMKHRRIQLLQGAVLHLAISAMACGRIGYELIDLQTENIDIETASTMDTNSDISTTSGTDSISGTDTIPSTEISTDTNTDTDTPIDTDTGTDTEEVLDTGVTWAWLAGGTFQMGSTLSGNEQPVHSVTIQAFSMAKTQTTVEQYMACVADGSCSDPGTWSLDCYWNREGFEKHPVNCISWHMASAFCQWTGGRLPSESEWEYAARSQGQDITYPWGDETPSCDFAVMNDGENGCGANLPHAVCSKEAGNTDQGLCDMAGNVFDWVQDGWHSNYNGAPTDGSAWEGTSKVVRGGSYLNGASDLRTAWRKHYFGPDYQNTFIGFRCARDNP